LSSLSSSSQFLFGPTSAWENLRISAKSLLPRPADFLYGLFFMVEIRLKRGESVDKALRRLKKKLDREGILRDARARRTYEKPSVRRRRKMKEPKINFYGNFSL
jgi:small subunit ribosomal protein S21